MSDLFWTVLFSKKAEKEFFKLDFGTQKKIREFVEKLTHLQNPRSLGHQLRGDLSRYWRFRVGAYRLITEIVDDRLIIQVIRVGHRREIYA